MKTTVTCIACGVAGRRKGGKSKWALEGEAREGASDLLALSSSLPLRTPVVSTQVTTRCMSSLTLRTYLVQFLTLSSGELRFHALVCACRQICLCRTTANFEHWLARHEDGAFQKRSSNRRNLKTAGFSFSCGRKTFWKQSFSKTMTSRKWCDFPDQVFVKHNLTGDCCVCKFLRRETSWTGPKATKF